MSGHSKWAGIKHKKAAEDKKRGKIFSKLSRAISVAASEGGGDPVTNPQLRLYIDKAKQANMPNDNIQRAVKKGTGELPGVQYEHMIFEGYGPGGVAILIDALSDNRNRTSSEIRHIFTRRSCSLAGAGSVNWQFEKKGFIMVAKEGIDEENLMEIAIDNGAEDFSAEKDRYEIVTSVDDFENIKNSLGQENISLEASELTMIPKNVIKLDGKDANDLLTLINELEDHDDIQNVYANFDIPDEIIENMIS